MASNMSDASPSVAETRIAALERELMELEQSEGYSPRVRSSAYDLQHYSLFPSDQQELRSGTKGSKRPPQDLARI